MVLCSWLQPSKREVVRNTKERQGIFLFSFFFFPSYDTRQALLLLLLPLLKLDPWNAQPIRALAGRDWPILGMMAREQGLALVYY